MNFKQAFLVSLFSISLYSNAYACLPCAAYNATELHGFSGRDTSVAISNAYTSFDTQGRVTRLRSGEVLKSVNVTELSLSHQISKRWSVQAAVPLKNRSFTEFESFRRRENSEFGIGDAVLLANYAPIIKTELDTTLFISFGLGLKLPTGETDSLQNTDVFSDSSSRLFHHISGTSSSGLQGRSLSLGSGSFDFTVDSKIFYRKRRAFFYGGFQYTIRTEGDFDYEFADDISWNIGPGYYLYLGGHDFSLAGRATFSGEDKANDKLAGQTLSGTAITNLYLGPEILATWRGKYTGELALDIPITTTSDALEEPEARIRASIGYRF